MTIAPASLRITSASADGDEIPCGAWSQHAAHLAERIGPLLHRWEETPATQVLVAEGQLVRLLPGVFVDGGQHLSMVDRAVAVGCALGPALRPHHVLGGSSAVWVLAAVPPTMPLDVLSSAHRSVIHGARIRHLQLDPKDVERIGGVPLTVPERTAADVLRLAPEHWALEAVQALISCGQADPRGIEQRLRRMQNVPGLPRARRLLSALPPPLPLTQLVEARAVTRFPSAVTR